LAAFYSDNPSKIFRLGDVVTGFHLPAFQIDAPGAPEKSTDVRINLTRPSYFAVMTPCCSIEDQSISLAPLIEIRHRFFEIPRLAEDMTRLNAYVQPEDSLPQKAWENMPPEKKQELLTRGPSYIFIECFVYEANALLKTYPLKKGNHEWPNVGYRMVDFKQIFRVECNQIERMRDAPEGIKLLELTIQARTTLRDKLAAFFARVPDEDAA
jgi:hypothetical protein